MKTKSPVCVLTPLYLFWAVLLCLPFSLVFTIIQPPTTTTSAATDSSNTTSSAIPTTSAATDSSNTTSSAIPTTSAATDSSNTTSSAIPTTPFNKTVNPGTAFPTPLRNSEKKQMKNVTTTPQHKPPPSTTELDDQKLFHRAAAVNPNPISPRKVAFMFLTSAPLPLAPLWEIYFNQTPVTLYNIYIHADPSVSYDPPFSGVFENRVIPESKPTRRHSPTLISAARRLISHALLDDPSNYMFALLSPSCVPIHSFNFTYETLTRSTKSFIEVLKHERGAYERWAVRGKHVMLPELPFSKFRIGSQFFVLTREHARIVANDTRLWSKFKLPCLSESTCYPEEHYFSSLISMESPGGYVPATLTRVDWRGRQDGHPRTYSASEVTPELILRFRRDRPRYGDGGGYNSNSSVAIRRDPFLFARKFSPDSLQPLLRIAKDVVFKD